MRCGADCSGASLYYSGALTRLLGLMRQAPARALRQGIGPTF